MAFMYRPVNVGGLVDQKKRRQQGIEERNKNTKIE